MRRSLLFFLAILFSATVSAQVITPDRMTMASSTIQDKLVELALQNPELEAADHEIKIAQYQLKEAKGWWVNNISLAFNANEFTVKRLKGETQANGQAYPYFPLYNFGVNIPIGSIFSKPAATKAARESVAIAQNNRASKYRQIKVAVLSTYEDYLANKELLTTQSQLTESAYNDYLQMKERFRNGQISIDDYNKSVQEYHNQLNGRINAQRDLNVTKIQLEALIGVPLSSVLDATGGHSSTDSTMQH